VACGYEVPSDLYCVYSIMKNNSATNYLTCDHFREHNIANNGNKLGFHSQMTHVEFANDVVPNIER
jgi:hypothetical protein